jgi:hypothetical protein
MEGRQVSEHDNRKGCFEQERNMGKPERRVMSRGLQEQRHAAYRNFLTSVEIPLNPVFIRLADSLTKSEAAVMLANGLSKSSK